ncbi:hypothetical protein ABHI18_006806 [Aspergillus niger]
MLEPGAARPSRYGPLRGIGIERGPVDVFGASVVTRCCVPQIAYTTSQQPAGDLPTDRVQVASDAATVSLVD